MKLVLIRRPSTVFRTTGQPLPWRNHRLNEHEQIHPSRWNRVARLHGRNARHGGAGCLMLLDGRNEWKLAHTVRAPKH